jgi:hypothetical protein
VIAPSLWLTTRCDRILAVGSTPVTRQLLAVFVCVRKRCAAGSWYPKQAHSPFSAFLSDAGFEARVRGSCEPCRFQLYPPAPPPLSNASALSAFALTPTVTFSSSCPAHMPACDGEVPDDDRTSPSLAHTSSLTGPAPRPFHIWQELSVLRSDNTFACKGSHGFYLASSIIMLIGFTIVVPYLFYTLSAPSGAHAGAVWSIAASPHRRIAASPHRRIAASPPRRLASHP